MDGTTVAHEQSLQKIPVSPGHWRIRVKTVWHPHCWAIVGNFSGPAVALRLAVDLTQAAPGAIRAVRIEHRNRGCWKTAWLAS